MLDQGRYSEEISHFVFQENLIVPKNPRYWFWILFGTVFGIPESITKWDKAIDKCLEKKMQHFCDIVLEMSSFCGSDI